MNHPLFFFDPLGLKVRITDWNKRDQAEEDLEKATGRDVEIDPDTGEVTITDDPAPGGYSGSDESRDLWEHLTNDDMEHELRPYDPSDPNSTNPCAGMGGVGCNLPDPDNPDVDDIIYYTEGNEDILDHEGAHAAGADETLADAIEDRVRNERSNNEKSQ